ASADGPSTMCSLAMTPSMPARSASTAKVTRSPISGVGRIVWFSVRMSSSRGVISGRPDADRQLLEPVGEVRPDPPRRPGQLQARDAPGQTGECHPDLKAGEMRAEAQMGAAATEAEVPVR